MGVDGYFQLTYMSIAAELESLLRRGRLFVRPSRFGAQARTLYVAPDLDAYTREPFPDTACGERLAAVAAYFDAFCELNLITVSENPYRKPPDVMLARVDPIKLNFWSMRITDPEETKGVRVLGAFCGKDAFIALTWDFREKIADFSEEVSNLSDLWRDYFGELAPHSGGCLDDYLTNYDEQ